MSHEGRDIDVQIPSINAIHDEALIDHFIDGIGRKLLSLTSSFPFIFIGEIIDVVEDYVVVDVETTSIAELEERRWHIHIHDIEVFYIERDDGPRIPELKDDLC